MYQVTILAEILYNSKVKFSIEKYCIFRQQEIERRHQVKLRQRHFPSYIIAALLWHTKLSLKYIDVSNYH